ncbi:DUF2169 domain-containing protein [Agrobacterium rubi]|uniref:DUF2169 family type VI secretion system accessory protein n=1 Tax=Agrobacterium rubi TaxID=28099 RepID=UPI001572AA5D|nr:DUF2169 domain-containing protein [Agrobacterium rubi]NTF08910.1 DUF2169 domain-containing protein [Agrobacterium rubi]NTF21181.1 DUF2169 domain-containing protein [Agrobacterium rubi]NTF28038.1 DUF2169 domain-containing protein [Agrobacterium rubi]
MPELKNLTPFPNFRYYSRDNENRELGIVIVKATYEIADDGTLVVAEEQAPTVFTDKCHGDVNVSSLWHPSDLVPSKPATDIIVNAVARAPDGKPSPSWECGISFERNGQVLLDKRLRVTGPRWWRPVWKRELREHEIANWRDHRRLFVRWELLEPEPIAKLALHYEYAFGGELETGHDDEGNTRFDTDHHNPIGIGKIDREYSDHTIDIPAPQIESPDDPIIDPYKSYAPVSFGPIPPAWLPLRPLGGTYDQDWIDNIWPAWPSDYSFAYHNAAHPDLIVSPYLRKGDTICLTNITEGGKLLFSLPRTIVMVDFVRADGTVSREEMILDTVFIDVAATRRRDWRIYLSWRVRFEPDIYSEAIVHLREKLRLVARPRADLEEA